MSPTPDQKRNIDKEKDSFGNNWYLDLNTIEIRHNPIPWWKVPIDIIWRKKNSVFGMYWWLKYERLSNEQSRSFDFPLIHDNMPIEGQPMKYQLQGKWTIPKKDLKFLSGGPLIDQDFKLLVRPNFVFKNFCSNVVPPIKVIAAIIGLCGTIIKWWPQISKLLL